MPGHSRFRLDDEQRRTPMAPEAVKRDPEKTIGVMRSASREVGIERRIFGKKCPLCDFQHGFILVV